MRTINLQVVEPVDPHLGKCGCTHSTTIEPFHHRFVVLFPALFRDWLLLRRRRFTLLSWWFLGLLARWFVLLTGGWQAVLGSHSLDLYIAAYLCYVLVGYVAVK